MMLLALLVSALIFGADACGNACQRKSNVEVTSLTYAGFLLSGGRRRLTTGEELNEICEQITEIVRGKTGSIIMNLISSAGQDQAGVLKQAKQLVIQECAANLGPEANAQCQFYVSLATTGDDLKAAWLDSFGSMEDHHQGCAAVVNSVNRRLTTYTNKPGSPITVNAQGQLSLDTTVDIDAFLEENESGEAAVVRAIAEAGEMMQVPVELDNKCTFVTGLTAAAITGASVVGVVLGHMCKAFEGAAYQAIENSPLL